jgi:hypothetical protein
MGTENSIRTELAAALRSVAAAYKAIPEDQRPDVSWAATDDVLEAALTAGNRQQALAAIADWKSHWLGLFSAVAR